MRGCNYFKKTITYCLILCIAVVALAPVYVVAKSYSGLHLGRTTWHGYFSNTDDEYGDASDPGVLPVIPAEDSDGSSRIVHSCEITHKDENGHNVRYGNNKTNVADGLAIPSCIDSKPELVKFLQTYNTSSDGQKNTGSAFIVCTMLAQDAIEDSAGTDCRTNGYVGDGRIITQKGWDELNARLNMDGINVDWTSTQTIQKGGINSYYQGNSTNDDAFYAANNIETREGILFSYKDKTVYRMFRTCANPVGGMLGLSEDTWSADVDVSVDKAEVYSGGSATWTHKAISDGVCRRIQLSITG